MSLESVTRDLPGLCSKSPLPFLMARPQPCAFLRNAVWSIHVAQELLCSDPLWVRAGVGGGQGGMAGAVIGRRRGRRMCTLHL